MSGETKFIITTVVLLMFGGAGLVCSLRLKSEVRAQTHVQTR